MSNKLPRNDVRQKLFKLQDMLFELHEQVRDLREKHASTNVFQSDPPITTLALAIQSAGEIRRLLHGLGVPMQGYLPGGGK